MMWGEVEVVQGGPNTVTVSATNNKWTPQIVQIGPNGTVTWKNAEVESNHNHIVVADGGGASTFCLNGRAYVGNTPTIVAELASGCGGTSLTWISAESGTISTRTRRAGDFRRLRAARRTSTA